MTHPVDDDFAEIRDGRQTVGLPVNPNVPLDFGYVVWIVKLGFCVGIDEPIPARRHCIAFCEFHHGLIVKQ